MRILIALSCVAVFSSDVALAMSISQRYAFFTNQEIDNEVCVPVNGSLPGNLFMENTFRKNGGYIGSFWQREAKKSWHYFTGYEACKQGIR